MPDQTLRQWPREQYGTKPFEPIAWRAAEPGELCPCGRQAIRVADLGPEFGETGDCGYPVDQSVSESSPCVFCGSTEPHSLRCPEYRLRLGPERDGYEVTRWTSRDGKRHEVVQRQAEPGELCTCGRPAITVYISEEWGETGHCGLDDGGQLGPCVFCGAPERHEGRCPAYRIRLGLERERGGAER